MDHGEFQKLGEMSTLNDKWIYESPDGGKTIYRRKIGAPIESREKYVQENLNIIMITTVMEILRIHSLRDPSPVR